MKNNIFRGWTKIFSFTFGQQVKSKSFKILTFVLAFLIVSGITAVMVLTNDTSDSSDSVRDDYVSPVQNVIVYDHSGTGEADYSAMSSVEKSSFEKIRYQTADSLEKAIEAAKNFDYALILDVECDDSTMNLNVLLPDSTALTEDDAHEYSLFLDEYYSYILVIKSGLTMQQMLSLNVSVTSEISSVSEEDGSVIEENPYETAKSIFRMILPYVNVMLLYFMILFYGQSVANSVVSEKTSKLMETFLVSVKPEAMILAKVLAIAIAGLLQLVIWVASVVGGFALGTYIVQLSNPETDMGIIQLFRSFGQASGMFSIGGIIVSLLILVAGFLLYCALASIGGAIASKQEELASTNSIFSMVLVISFLFTVYAGSSSAGIVSTVSALYYVPFTSILIAPGRILVGDLSILNGIISLVIVAASALVIIILSGKLYSMTALYSGSPLTPKKAFMMLKESHSKKTTR